MTTNRRNQVDPTAYYNSNGEFQAYSFAEELTESRDGGDGEPLYPFATDEETDTLYFHNGRIWHPGGEKLLRDETRRILRDTATREKVNEIVRNVKALTRQRREQIFDLPPEKVVLRNGVIDLKTGEYSEGFNLPGTLTWVDVEYKTDARPERFTSFLYDILPDEDVPVMWELIGYCLYRGYPFQKAAMFIGDGSNGKSTLLKALGELLGKKEPTKNVSSIKLKDLAENRFAPAGLEGKLANLAPDIDSSELKNTGTFKALTGGDLITAERKHKDSFQFENAATLIFSANSVPAANDKTHAYERRWLYFDFPEVFDEDDDDTDPQEELLQDFRKEHSGILNTAVEAFQRLWDRGHFPETTHNRKEGHERTMNPVKGLV